MDGHTEPVREPQPVEARPPRRALGLRVLLGAVLLVNAALLVCAAIDRSAGAVLIGLVAGPMVNGVLALLSLACTPWIRRLTGDTPGRHAALSLLIPLAAIVADGLLIAWMRPSVC